MRASHRIVLAIVGLSVLAVLATGSVLWEKGYRVYVIHTGSMVPTFNPGDVVIDKPPSGHYHAGEVLTFRDSATTSDVVTHRVTSLTAAGLIHTKGDANRTADAWQINPDHVRGQTIFSVRDLGYVAVYLKQPAGIGSLATAVLALVLLWGLFFPATAEADDRAESRARAYVSRHSSRCVPVIR